MIDAFFFAANKKKFKASRKSNISSNIISWFEEDLVSKLQLLINRDFVRSIVWISPVAKYIKPAAKSLNKWCGITILFCLL